MTTEAYYFFQVIQELYVFYSPIKHSGKIFSLNCFHYKNFQDHCLGFDVRNSINFSKSRFPLGKIRSQDFLGFFASSGTLVCSWS